MRRKGLWFLMVGAHSVLLMFLFFYLLALPYTYDNESQIISVVKIFKHVLLGMEEKPDKDDFLFVNIAYQKQLVPRYDEYGFEIGNEPITDRGKLAAFFSGAAASNVHRFILCDVFFENPSPADSLLESALLGIDNIVFPYHFNEGELIKPVVSVPSALSDYQSDYGTFTKYSYVQHDTCVSIALAMFQQIHNESYRLGFLHGLKGKTPVLNSALIDMPVRQYDVFREDTLGYSSIHLQNLLELPDEVVSDLLKNRIVVIGDFVENDFHETFYGTIAGPLVHVNAYLTLRNGWNEISIWFFLYLVICSVFISVFLFSETEYLKTKWIAKIENSKMGWILDYLKYASFLLLVSVVSYFLFGIFLNILLVSFYFSIIENVHEWYDSKYGSKG